MRILINDYCGHPFQVELSRELARRGHELMHLYSADDVSPKGDLQRSPADPAGFQVSSVSHGEKQQKYGSLVRRWKQERAYGRLVCRGITGFAPDVVIASNNPLEAQNLIRRHCQRSRIPFIYWLQDLHSDAIRSYLAQRSRVAGVLAGHWYESMEQRLLRTSSHIVAIAEDFLPRLHEWEVPGSRISVIENWAPRDKIRRLPAENAWRAAKGLTGRRVVLYTGTIGIKHNPDLLLQGAQSFREEPDVAFVVTSEGKYAEYLRTRATDLSLTNLMVLPFQPFDSYSEVLASGDVLVAMIEPEAASYSVPSKVLSYLCSGRPIVLAARSSNLAARTLTRANAGVVVEPRETGKFIDALRSLLADPASRAAAGDNARRYAESAFDIEAIADRFESVLQTCSGQGIRAADAPSLCTDGS